MSAALHAPGIGGTVAGSPACGIEARHRCATQRHGSLPRARCMFLMLQHVAPEQRFVGNVQTHATANARTDKRKKQVAPATITYAHHTTPNNGREGTKRGCRAARRNVETPPVRHPRAQPPNAPQRGVQPRQQRNINVRNVPSQRMPTRRRPANSPACSIRAKRVRVPHAARR